MNKEKYRLGLYETLNQSDINFIKYKAFKANDKSMVEALKSLRLLGYEKDELVEAIKKMIITGNTGESQLELVKRKGITESIDDINYIDEEEWADEDGWF